MEYRDHLSGHNYPPTVHCTDAFLFLRFAGCPWQSVPTTSLHYTSHRFTQDICYAIIPGSRRQRGAKSPSGGGGGSPFEGGGIPPPPVVRSGVESHLSHPCASVPASQPAATTAAAAAAAAAAALCNASTTQDHELSTRLAAAEGALKATGRSGDGPRHTHAFVRVGYNRWPKHLTERSGYRDRDCTWKQQEA